MRLHVKHTSRSLSARAISIAIVYQTIGKSFVRDSLTHRQTDFVMCPMLLNANALDRLCLEKVHPFYCYHANQLCRRFAMTIL